MAQRSTLLTDTDTGMISAISSGFSSPVIFNRQESKQIQYDHDHISEGCASCQPKNEKTSTSADKISGTVSIKDKKNVEEKSKISASLQTSSHELTPEERKQVEELKKRDQEVRRHEQAHLAAAGAHARGGPSFTYQKGPDGKMYAIGGEVPIDLSPVAHDPQATIQKAEAIQRAALAPAEPSGPDRQVAAKAAALATKARQELTQQSQEITTPEEKDEQKSSPVNFQELSSSPSGTRSRQEISLFSSLDFSSYSQQKQKYRVPSAGSLLNIYL